MRLRWIEQLHVGDVVKCVMKSGPSAGVGYIGVVTRIDRCGRVHVWYHDGDACFYDNDDDVEDENLYKVNKESK